VLPGLSFPDASVRDDGTACCSAKVINYNYFCAIMEIASSWSLPRLAGLLAMTG